MFGKVTREKLERAGFQLESCEDGHFWVYEKEPGEEAGRLLRICRLALDGFEEESVKDVILIQCGADFSEPTLYLDGYLWNLSKRDLSDIAALLFKERQKMARERMNSRTSRRDK